MAQRYFFIQCSTKSQKTFDKENFENKISATWFWLMSLTCNTLSQFPNFVFAEGFCP